MQIKVYKIELNQMSKQNLNIPGTIYSTLIGLRKSRRCNHSISLCVGNSTVWKLDYRPIIKDLLSFPITQCKEVCFTSFLSGWFTLEYGINIPPWINIAPGTFGKKKINIAPEKNVVFFFLLFKIKKIYKNTQV